MEKIHLDRRMELLGISSHMVNGERVLTVRDFCKLVDHSAPNIHTLYTIGNRYGAKLRTLRIGSSIFVLLSEYFNYHFVNRRGECYTYNTYGERVIVPTEAPF